jgi:hypothetical protein
MEADGKATSADPSVTPVPVPEGALASGGTRPA